jgi:hypothetical protein
VGQGFIIDGLVNGTVQMKNSYRVFVKEGLANNSQFEPPILVNQKTTEAYLSSIKSVSDLIIKRLVQHLLHKYDLIHC